jgi:hypothetical protein
MVKLGHRSCGRRGQVNSSFGGGGRDVERFADLEVAPRFWELIAAARGDKAMLHGLLSEVDRDELIRFAVEFDHMADDLVSQATDQEGDTYHEEDVAGWVISQGLRRFARVYDGEEEFPDEVPDWDSNLKGMAVVVWAERFGQPMPRHSVERWPTTHGRDLLR